MLRRKKKRSGANPTTTSNTTTTTSNKMKSNLRKSSNSLEHKLTSDFIYTSPYELPPNSRPNVHNLILENKGVTKTDTPTSLIDERLSEVYSPTSVSFKISTTSLHSPVPPPLPERNTTFHRRSIQDDSGGNRSAESSSRIITPPPLIDIKARLQASKNKNSASPTFSKTSSFRNRKNSIESIKSNLSRTTSNVNNLANNLEVLLEVHESSGPTTMTNSTSSQDNNNEQIEKQTTVDESSSIPKSKTNSIAQDLSNASPSLPASSENEQGVGSENTNVEHVVSAQIHRNTDSALSMHRSSNRSSRKSVQIPSPPRRKTLPFPSHVKNIASTQNSNSLPNPAQSSALQQLQALDLFKATNSEDEAGSDDTNGPEKSICLETDQYVKQIKQKRGKLLSQLDSTPGDRLRRKVGYEIERRLVKVSYSMKNGYSNKMNNKRRARRSRHSRNEHHHHNHYGHHPNSRGDKTSSNEDGIWAWFKNMFTWLFWWDKEEHLDENDLRRKRRRQRYRRQRRRHRFCFRCVTSSFYALFLYIGRPFTALSSKLTHSDELINVTSSSSNNITTNTGNTTTTTTSRSDNNTNARNVTSYGGDINSSVHPRSKSQLSMAATVLTIADSENSRTPTPKMLLDVKTGTLNWPVYQVGGKKGSGMLISSRAIYPAPADESSSVNHQPGRENFSLVPVEVSSDEKMKGETLNRNNLAVIDMSGSGLSDISGGGRKLVGWLQVRDPKNKKSFLQVVDPAPKGPFRKAPWHNGNFHVLKL